MKNILVTGATGNIGIAVVKYLVQFNTANRIIVGVRNIEKAKQIFIDFPDLVYTLFDFEAPETFDKALSNVDSIFLLRPPHIADVEMFFKPLIQKIQSHKINEVLFLSVQGAEKIKFIPHHKIEKLILEAGLSYIFLRPSYFMQNLTTTLLSDIQTKRKIVLPSGKAKFNWVDVSDIGEVAALLLVNFSIYKNQALELTGSEIENFYKVAEIINSQVVSPVKFVSVNPYRFYNLKMKDGFEKGMVLVMLMLHFLPRLQKVPNLSDNYEKITGKKPTTLLEFVKRERKYFQELKLDNVEMSFQP